MAHVAAARAEPRRAVELHAGRPVARHAQHAAPGVVDRGAPRRGEELVQHAHELRDGPALGAAVAVGPRAEAVGHAAAAQRDAAVRGVLHVDVGVGLVAEQLRALPADLVPDGRAESGSVTTIAELSGSSLRRSPRSDAVKPSRQVSTIGARTLPRRVRATPGATSVTAVPS